jgi:hypothetical protein
MFRGGCPWLDSLFPLYLANPAQHLDFTFNVMFLKRPSLDLSCKQGFLVFSIALYISFITTTTIHIYIALFSFCFLICLSGP